MYWFGFLFVLLFVVQGFFSLDEEMLIILAGIFWLDAAGALIRNIIEKELVYKAVLIKDNFLWFLQKQRENIQEKLAKILPENQHIQIDCILRVRLHVCTQLPVLFGIFTHSFSRSKPVEGLGVFRVSMIGTG